MTTNITIYHIALTEEWNSQLKNESYFPAAYQQEGFIHCSQEYQLKGVVERFFKKAEKVFLLSIDTTKLVAELRLEEASNGDFFPHIYGELNKTAIIKVELISVIDLLSKI
jgi:uncharacterized protein (DUF952 family)